MKVGTDGVILGAWCGLSGEEKKILDIGTGTGLIALMAAQRTTNSEIDAVEIDGPSAQQAAENFKASPWSERLNILNTSIQRYAATTATRYDHIISNPPYFINSLESPDKQRTVARHTSQLSHDDLIAAVKILLGKDGRFSAIFPYAEANIFIAQAAVEGLYCNRRLNIHPIPEAPSKRVALEFSSTRSPLDEEELAIENGARHDYTTEYRELTKDFYLKF